MAINVLLQSAAQFLLTTPEPGEVISAKTARSIFRTLLRLPTSEEQPALILPQTSSTENALVTCPPLTQLTHLFFVTSG